MPEQPFGVEDFEDMEAVDEDMQWPRDPDDPDSGSRKNKGADNDELIADGREVFGPCLPPLEIRDDLYDVLRKLRLASRQGS